MNFALGKKPPAHLMSTVALSEHIDSTQAYPAVPAQGYEYAPLPIVLDNLGNDDIGLCVIAAAMHYAQVETANTGNPLTPTRALAIATYSAITGYDPSQTDANGNNPTDQGTDFESQLFPYWKKTGMPMLDKNGKEVMHTILGFAALDLTSIAQQRYALRTFGGKLTGFNCPESVVGNTTNWNDPSGPIAGGHGVTEPGQGADGWHTISWGALIPGTWQFSRATADEMYVVETPLWLNAQGKSPVGLDLNGLTAAMAAL
jgi:hypothetical protein